MIASPFVVSTSLQSLGLEMSRDGFLQSTRVSKQHLFTGEMVLSVVFHEPICQSFVLHVQIFVAIFIQF